MWTCQKCGRSAGILWAHGTHNDFWCARCIIWDLIEGSLDELKFLIHRLFCPTPKGQMDWEEVKAYDSN
jgi:hypothetical protein